MARKKEDRPLSTLVAEYEAAASKVAPGDLKSTLEAFEKAKALSEAAKRYHDSLQARIKALWRVQQGSERIELHSGYVARLTRQEPQFSVDYGLLRERIGEETFQSVTRPTGYELVPERWEQAVRHEEVTREDLDACISEREGSLVGPYIE